MSPERPNEGDVPAQALGTPDTSLGAPGSGQPDVAGLTAAIEGSQTGRSLIARGFDWVWNPSTGRGKWVYRGVVGVAVASGIFLAGRQIGKEISRRRNNNNSGSSSPSSTT